MAALTHRAQRPVLLLLPGLLCDAGLWRHQLPALRDLADVRLADLALDNSLGAMAARALEGLPPRFAVAAFSMGGYVAFELLRQAPGRVARLCLMGTSARPDRPDQARRRRALMTLVARGSAAAGGRFRGVTPGLLPLLLHPGNQGDGALFQELADMADRIGKAAYLRQQAAVLGRTDSRPDLPGIAVPTLVLVGEADAMTPPGLSQEIARGIPAAVLHQVPGAGHMLPLEQPAAVRHWLLDWLRPETLAGRKRTAPL